MLTCCCLYAVNRWCLKPALPSPFLQGQFNDLLLIPCALPVVLWLQRRLGLRDHDRPPSAAEIIGHLALWAVLFEFVAPLFIRTTGDPLDVLAYTVGAVMAAWIWHRPRSHARFVVIRGWRASR